ncbi:hypothetical protein AYO22_00096 [Fonsecaea multimorphosa]|nr:hypothetical protein AYO22_00096 [Fonsecaea multimorphosa]
MTELEMWRLIRGRTCQFCGKKTAHQQRLSVSEPWYAGPGLDGVRPIWPFRDAELIVSTYSALRPGLPFAILTQELSYIPSTVIQQKSPPPNLDLVKYYFRPQFEELQSEFHDVKDLGAAAVAEWYKGLETVGQQSNADAARFEQWELQGGLSRVSTVQGQTGSTLIPSSMSVTAHADLMQAFDNIQQSSVNSAVGTPSSGNLFSELSTAGIHEAPGPPLAAVGPGPLAHPAPPVQPPVRPPRQKTERSLKEAKEARAERRKEIERRCLALEPPIMPSTLAYMDAFQAAILISRPLDDKAWEILKPRLLAQRADAEHRESKLALRDPNIQLQKRQQLEEEQRVAQANASHMWIELKIPARDKLQRYAQDFIQQTWSDGRAVTRATATQEDRMLELKGTAFPQDQASLACRKLTLEDMKWVYEEFVKPHTDKFGKELFLCHVCDINQKLFAFEAVIQHFAAKHTNSFSSGNSIVYWKADWPLEPPFDPHPNIPWALEVTGTMSRMQPHQQARQGFPTRGPPSSIESGPKGSDTFLQPVTASQWFSGSSQHINQNSYSASARMHSLNAGRLPPGLETRDFRDSVAGSSIARSEVSGYTNEDEPGPRYQHLTFTRPAPSNIQYYQGSYSGGKAGDEINRSHSGKAVPRREEPHHSFETGRGWETWKQQGPISHGSMIYSYGDGSSRFSYGESLQRDGGTSVDGTSEAGRASKATSRLSLRRETPSESRAPTSEIETSRDQIHQAATNAAVENFLNNFSPMVVEDSMDAAKDVAATAHAIDLQQPRNVPGLHSTGIYPQQHEIREGLDSRAMGRVSPPSRQRRPLPIRGHERPTVWADDPPTQLRYSPMPPDRDREFTRELAHSGRYEGSGRTLQSRYDAPNESMRDVAAGYAMPSYEPQYFYSHDGRRYVELSEQSMERYALRAGDFSERYHEVPEVGGSDYLDNRRYFLERHLEHDDRVRAASREDRLGDNNYHSAQIRGPPFEYDGRYSHEEVTFEPHTRSGRISTREITYEPIEQPRRYTPRSFGTGRSGE